MLPCCRGWPGLRAARPQHRSSSTLAAASSCKLQDLASGKLQVPAHSSWRRMLSTNSTTWAQGWASKGVRPRTQSSELPAALHSWHADHTLDSLQGRRGSTGDNQYTGTAPNWGLGRVPRGSDALAATHASAMACCAAPAPPHITRRPAQHPALQHSAALELQGISSLCTPAASPTRPMQPHSSSHLCHAVPHGIARHQHLVLQRHARQRRCVVALPVQPALDCPPLCRDG